MTAPWCVNLTAFEIEVDEHLAHPARVPVQPARHAPVDLGDDVNALGARRDEQHRADLADRVVQRKVVQLELDAAGLDFREVEDVVDHEQQALGRRAGDVHVLLLALVELGVKQQLGRSEDPVQRRAQLMADLRHEQRLRVRRGERDVTGCRRRAGLLAGLTVRGAQPVVEHPHDHRDRAHRHHHVHPAPRVGARVREREQRERLADADPGEDRDRPAPAEEEARPDDRQRVDHRAVVRAGRRAQRIGDEHDAHRPEQRDRPAFQPRPDRDEGDHDRGHGENRHKRGRRVARQRDVERRVHERGGAHRRGRVDHDPGVLVDIPRRRVHHRAQSARPGLD